MNGRSIRPDLLRQFTSIGRKIIGVGRNYAEHAAELNNPLPSKPIIFMKPTSCYITEPDEIEVPVGCQEIHHEVELGVVMGGYAKQLKPEDCM